MRIRSFVDEDLSRLTDFTIDIFQQFYEDSFRPLVGDRVFTNQHGRWREDYRTQVAELHDPARHRYVAIADSDGDIAGYVAWDVDAGRRSGRIQILAVATGHRRTGLGSALCNHAFDAMRSQGAEVAVIGTGGDAFHEPARALYESLRCTPLPVVVYYKQL